MSKIQGDNFPERGGDRIPDEATILTFRHLLEKRELGWQIFKTVKPTSVLWE